MVLFISCSLFDALWLRNCYISLSSIFITVGTNYMCFRNSLILLQFKKKKKKISFLSGICLLLAFYFLCKDVNKVMMLFWGLII